MALRALILVDASLGEAQLERLRRVAGELEGGERGTARILSGDEAALTTLASSLSSRPRFWTERSLAPGAASPAPMSAAPFLFTDEGRPDWANMWTSFCDLALHGGAAHRGPDDPVIAPAPEAGRVADQKEVAPDPEFDAVTEIQRGILETTGLRAEQAGAGWLSITCGSRRMAAWMCASIILENVDARSDGPLLFVPGHPSFELKDQVKSVITVVAKVHHYWQAHLAGATGSSAVALTDDEVPGVVRRYREVLTSWGRARAARDSGAARELHEQMHALTGQLAPRTIGRSAIEDCLSDDDVWVRLWSATEALAWAPERARRVLTEIRDARAAAAVDAEWALLQHAAGRKP